MFPHGRCDAMLTLFALRHAKSSHADDSLPDHDRPLTERGRRAAPRMGQLLLDKGLVPDAILSSTSQRTHETAELLADACGFTQRIHYDERLYLASADLICRVVARHGGKATRLMVVGHNPGLEELILRLTGRRETMPTAALAQIDLSIDSWAEIASQRRGTLVNLWSPRDIEAEE